MAGGVVRLASKQVSATREILMGSVLALAGGMAWRSWHVSYKAAIDDFYVKYEADKKAEASK